MKSPCLNCKARHLNCHSVCDKYKEYHAKNEERLELKKKSFEKENPTKDYKLTMYQKYLKNKGRNKK